LSTSLLAAPTSLREIGRRKRRFAPSLPKKDPFLFGVGAILGGVSLYHLSACQLPPLLAPSISHQFGQLLQLGEIQMILRPSVGGGHEDAKGEGRGAEKKIAFY